MSARARHRRRAERKGDPIDRLRRAAARATILEAVDPEEDDDLLDHLHVKPHQAAPTPRCGTEMAGPLNNFAKGGEAHRLSSGAPAYTA